LGKKGTRPQFWGQSGALRWQEKQIIKLNGWRTEIQRVEGAKLSFGSFSIHLTKGEPVDKERARAERKRWEGKREIGKKKTSKHNEDKA